MPIPIHGEGIDIKIIMKELEQEPPKSKVITPIIEKTATEENRNSSASSVIKPIKMVHVHFYLLICQPKESNGPELFLSNDEAIRSKQSFEAKKTDLFNKAMASFFEQENFIDSSIPFLIQQKNNFSRETIGRIAPDICSRINLGRKE